MTDQPCRGLGIHLLAICVHRPDCSPPGQGFFSKFVMGGDSKFSVPIGPRWGRSRMGGTCEKNPTEAKTAHLMQN